MLLSPAYLWDHPYKSYVAHVIICIKDDVVKK